MWTLRTGIHVARKLEEILDGKYHVALGGGVLHKGKSFHDLDLVVYPHKTYESFLYDVREAAESMGMVLRTPGHELLKKWREQDNYDDKHVDVWDYKGRRVDIICLLWEEG